MTWHPKQKMPQAPRQRIPAPPVSGLPAAQRASSVAERLGGGHVNVCPVPAGGTVRFPWRGDGDLGPETLGVGLGLLAVRAVQQVGGDRYVRVDGIEVLHRGGIPDADCLRRAVARLAAQPEDVGGRLQEAHGTQLIDGCLPKVRDVEYIAAPG